MGTQHAMSHADALRMERKARGGGMPRDAFVRNFSR